MKTMLVGICYNTDGTRYINRLYYSTFRDALEVRDMADTFKRTNDEVYSIDLDPANKNFIEEIVLHGCRM